MMGFFKGYILNGQLGFIKPGINIFNCKTRYINKKAGSLERTGFLYWLQLPLDNYVPLFNHNF